MNAQIPVRIGLALLLAGSGLAVASGPSSLVLAGTTGLALVAVLAGAKERGVGPTFVWVLCAIGVQVAATLQRRGPDATPIDDVIHFVAIPLALGLLANQSLAMTRSLSGALATSEVARAKLTRSNTELAEAVDQTEAALAKLGALVDNLAEGLLAISREGTIELANPSVDQLLSTEVSPGMHMRDVLPPDLRDQVMDCLDTVEVRTQDFTLEGGIGQAVVSPVVRNGVLWGTVVLIRDITLDREIDRMKSDFIAVVSHEMRTPLTSILGFTKLISNQLEGKVFPVLPEGDAKIDKATGRIRTNLGVIAAEGERLSELITNVLDLAKMESGQVEWTMIPLEPRSLVEHAVQATQPLFDERENVSLLVSIPEELPGIEGDRGRLVQVLINLLSNALKFTDEGQVTASVAHLDGRIEFSVRDTGVGIRSADQELVFDKFRQVGDTLTDRPTGTGLGLPICREIVLQHGGTIDVESEVDVGSRFYFTIPVTEDHRMGAS